MKKAFLRIASTLVSVLILCGVSAYAEETISSVRIKDICKILESRDNQLLGFGLVIGLKNTGDTSQSEFTKMALKNVLDNENITNENGTLFKSKNVAAVMVTADLPPFLKPGQRIDVSVSSIGDARSLQGGTLLLAPLKGADGEVYAVAQGAILVGGIAEYAKETSFVRNQTTVGRISNGAIVEKEVAIKLDDKDHLTLALNKSDFTTAARISYAINESGLAQSMAKDSTSVLVMLEDEDKNNMVEFISKLEELTVNPDSVAKIVVSERTGTVVIGHNVKLSPVAVTHGSLSVRIEKNELTQTSKIKYYEKPSKLVQLTPGSTLSSLIDALNAVGTSPRDLIAILEAIKEAGALSAELEII